MAAERTFTITHKYIINEGQPDEFSCDEVYLLRDWDFFSDGYPVYVYCQNGKYGILDYTGKILVSSIYDKIERFAGGDGRYEPFYECVLATKNNKQGIITYDGQIIFPFIYECIETKPLKYASFKKRINDIKHMLYSVTKNKDIYKRKYGLAEFPSGKTIFKEGKYSCFVYEAFYNYNVAIKTKGFHEPLQHHFTGGCTADIFYEDGTIVYSGKCYSIGRHERYKNVFIINGPGGYDASINVRLCICYKTPKRGIQRVYTRDFKLDPCLGYPRFLEEKILRDPAIKKRLIDTRTYL